MEQTQERWKRPRVRLAILALVVVGVYFLGIFVKQTWNLFQLAAERRAKQEEVGLIEEEIRELEWQVAIYTGEEGIQKQIESNLPYVRLGQSVIFVVEMEEGETPASLEGEVSEPAGEDVASLPVWRQWLRVIFAPAGP